MFPQPSAILSVLRSLRPRASRWVLLLLGIFLAATAGISQSHLPSKPQGYVNDFAGVLSPSARAQLTALCTEVDQKTHAQIAVVTVPSLDGKPVEDYAVDLATKWGVGPKQSDRGILILLAIKDHKYWTEVGYGLEPILPDGKVGGFGREAVPLLRQGNYDAALFLMTRLVANVIAQDSHVTLTGRPPLIRVRRRSSPPFPVFFWLILFVFWLISSVLRRLIPSSRRRGS
ncbi:MAG TPA: TPM domain-containing protein, partial [Candidatus Acidoferrales bacterium]|nr:TPM domain-containing protein [Candidatus Acidoferrales bacterium]